MIIHSGLNDFQVLQRDADGYACANIIISSPTTSTLTGLLEYRICHGDTDIQAWTQVSITTDETNETHCRYNATLTNIPTGGAYTIELRMHDQPSEHCCIRELLVGDLWIMGGQSNMQGVGNMTASVDARPRVHMFSMRDQWKHAKDPVNFCPESLDQAHRGKDPFREDTDISTLSKDLIKGVGPGIAFANYLEKEYGIPIGLIPCAKGGSAMIEWKPKKKGRHSLYGALLRRVAACGGHVTGMIWSQGCSDAIPRTCTRYRTRMEEMFRSLREDLNCALPCMLLQINGYFHSGRRELPGSAWSAIRSMQVELPQHIPDLNVVSSIDLDLDDGIHLSGVAQQRAGVRLARAASPLYDPQSTLHRCPRIRSVCPIIGNRIANTEAGSFAVIIENFNGDLISDGSKVLGFSIRDRDGNKCPTIFHAFIHDNMIILKTEIIPVEYMKYQLYYGYGLTPLCNITDSNDQALLSSGPHNLEP